MLTFPLPVKAQMSDTWASPTRIVQFGGECSERSADGLNRPSEVWDVECAFSSPTAGANLQTFLNTVGGWQAFRWKSPRDAVAQSYVIIQPVGGSVRRGGGSKPYFYTRSLKFKKIFNSASSSLQVIPTISISAPISVIEGNSINATVIRSGDTTESLTVNYSVSGTATSGVDYATLSEQVIIANGNSSANILISAEIDTINEVIETIVITLTDDSGYQVDIRSASINLLNKSTYGNLIFRSEFEGADNSTNFIDEIGSTVAIVPGGNSFISTAQAVNSTSSLNPNGSGLIITSSIGNSIYNLGSNFTISFDIFPTQQLTGYTNIIGRFSPTPNRSEWGVFFFDNNIISFENGVRNSFSDRYSASCLILTNKWTNIRLSRVGNTLSFYANNIFLGQSQVSFSSTGDVSNPVYIGCFFTGVSSFAGYIDNLEVYKS